MREGQEESLEETIVQKGCEGRSRKRFLEKGIRNGYKGKSSGISVGEDCKVGL